MVPAPRQYHLAEGATVWTFDTRLAIANVGIEPAPVTVTFMKEDGTTVQANLTVAVGARETLRVADVPGMVFVSFGTLVESTAGTPLVVERTMTWDGGHGAHVAGATETLGLRWYFAEGVQGAFDTYIVMANPGDIAADVTMTFLPQGGAPVVRTAQVAPRSRVTLWAGAVPELSWQSFSTVIDATQPIVAERAVYFGSARVWDGGTAAMGITTLSTDWHFAEGATGSIFSLYLLLFNPNASDATSTVTYLFPDGTTEQHTYPVAAASRRTIWVNGESPALGLSMGIAMHVQSDLPLTAERAMVLAFGLAGGARERRILACARVGAGRRTRGRAGERPDFHRDGESWRHARRRCA